MTRVILITGASSGIGKRSAEKLLAQGDKVYAAARRTERMQDLQQQGASILHMDVTDTTSVVAGVQQIIREQGRIDVVVSNAGYGSYGMIETIPIEELQRQFDVNVFGMARVLQAVLPYMRQQRKGRVIITASILSNISTIGLGWYASTKHALHAIGVALRQEVKHLGIDVIMIEPGGVKTGFGDIALTHLDAISPDADYQAIQAAFRQITAEEYETSEGPERTANAIVKAISARKPKTIYRTTRDAQLLPPAAAIVPDEVYDALCQSRLKPHEKNRPG